ncbi:MAG: DUF2085 domain-containing protein [Ignavibacteriales bacterium]|nr:DUF2085 domain-containing protein [Ignavibacteriales bacterium]
MTNRKVHIIIFVLTTLWCTAIIAPPMLNVWLGEGNIVSKYLYHFYSPVCHQFDSHSFHLFGYKLSVCARCSSIYFGFLFVVLIHPIIRRNKINSNTKLWVIAAFPMVLDVILDFLNLHSATMFSRFVTGIIFGSAAAFVLIPVLKEAISSIKINFYSYRRSST